MAVRFLLAFKVPVAQVQFAEWSDDGILRHPSFQGLRMDKSPKEVVRE